MTLDDLTRLVCAKVAEQRLRTLAKVCESARVTDVAVQSPRGAYWLLRCTEDHHDNDRLVLATILAQGPFVRAGLLCCETADDVTHPPSGGHPPADVCTLEALPDLLATWVRQERD